MCAQNQAFEIEGICESPHDFPAKLAAMIYGYFDESGESGEGYFVLAGFIGRRKDWKKFIPLWQNALGDHGPLHMKDLRLGSPKAKRKYGELLKRLAKVPKASGLVPFVGTVRTTDYSERTNGTIAEIVMQGYPIALCALVDAILHSNLPKQDRIEFTFEEQVHFATVRAKAFSYWRSLPHYKSHHGKSRVGKDSSMEKGSTLLQSADYLAYAVLQQLVDPNSQKSILSSPLLAEFNGIAHKELDKSQADYLLDYFAEQSGQPIPLMDVNKKRYLKKRMKEDYPVTASIDSH